jgi:hypothetical protein
MRRWVPWAAVVVGLAIGCRIPMPYRERHLTGTCEGACDHYLECKGSHDPSARGACVQDCDQVFQDRESIRAFESLECPDTIEYVEGSSGHGPGTMIGQPRHR